MSTKTCKRRATRCSRPQTTARARRSNLCVVFRVARQRDTALIDSISQPASTSYSFGLVPSANASPVQDVFMSEHRDASMRTPQSARSADSAGSSPGQMNDILAKFFAEKGGAPLSPVEYAGVVQLLQQCKPRPARSPVLSKRPLTSAMQHLKRSPSDHCRRPSRLNSRAWAGCRSLRACPCVTISFPLTGIILRRPSRT